MSVSEKITSIENHISEAYTSLANMGADLTNIDKNIENISSKIDEIYNNAPKTSYVEGSNISISNSLKGKVEYEDNKVVKGNTSQNTLTGKNLFNNIYQNNELNDLTIVVNEDKSLRITGTANASTFLNLGTISVEANTRYRLSGSPTGGGNTTHQLYMSNSSLGISAYDRGSGTTFTPTSSGTVNVMFVVYNGATTNFNVYPMIRLASVSDDTYEPYCGGIPSPNPSYPQNINVVTGENTITIDNGDGLSQTYPISLGTLELCKIGNYQDYIYKDNGKWYKYGAIGKKLASQLTVDNLNLATQGGFIFSIGGITTTKSACVSNILTYKSTVDTAWNTKNGVYIGQLYSGYENIYINKDFTTKTEMLTWLTTNNFILYYVLATPTSTEITDDGLISELEELYNMYSYSGTTNISISGNLPFIMKVRGLKGN